MYSPITDLDKIKQLATQHHDDFEVMRYQLEINADVTDQEIDALVEEVAHPIIGAIDCTQCANCCQSLDVYLTLDDAKRLAAGTNQSVEHVTQRYIHKTKAKKVEEWGIFRDKPCTFLRGKLCSIYGYRPQSCRIYPMFTPNFRWTLQHTIAGAPHCPIIYNVLITMLDAIDSLYDNHV